MVKEKLGVNCQPFLSEIGLTTDSSHSTWFHKTVRFYRSKSSRVLFYMKKIWLSMFYSIRVGEEPNSVFLKEVEPSQDDRILLLLAFLRQRSYRNFSYLFFHSRVLMCFHTRLRPRKMEKFLFLGTHTRFLTTSFMNFIVIDISYWDRICNLLYSCLAGKNGPP